MKLELAGYNIIILCYISGCVVCLSFVYFVLFYFHLPFGRPKGIFFLRVDVSVSGAVVVFFLSDRQARFSSSVPVHG